jgi:hypothetical protein
MTRAITRKHPEIHVLLVQQSAPLRILTALSMYIPSWRWKKPWSSASILWRTITWWVIRRSLRDMLFGRRRCWAKTAGGGGGPLTAKARVRSQVSLFEISGGKIDTGKCLSPNNFAFSCQYHSNSAPYSYSYTYCSYYKDKGAKLTSLGNSNVHSEIGEQWTEKYFHYKRKTKKPYKLMCAFKILCCLLTAR